MMPGDEKIPASSSVEVQTVFDCSIFSDTDLRCGSATFRCHKAILIAQSKYFMKGLISGAGESVRGYMNLSDDSPEVVGSVLQCIYTGELDLDKSNSFKHPAAALEGKTGHIILLTNLYAAAVKYEMPALKTAVISQIGECLKISDEHTAEATILAFENTPAHDRGLRDQFVTYLARRLSVHTDTFAKLFPGIEHKVEQIGGEISLASTKHPLRMEEYVCPHCTKSLWLNPALSDGIIKACCYFCSGQVEEWKSHGKHAGS